MSDVTLVVTSCGRPDLLDRTLKSFYALNTFPLARTIVIEDGPANPPGFPVPDLTYIANEVRLGQAGSIDRAYAAVDTPYVLHWEDDWETCRGGFMEPSLEILQRYPEILQVRLTPHDKTNAHPVVNLPQFDVPTMSTDFEWHGFSWNPGLRRMSDYQRIGGYSRFKRGDGFETELAISSAYHSLGYHAAILPEPAGYVRHIGGPFPELRNLTFADGLDRWFLGGFLPGSFTEHASRSRWRDYASTANGGIATLSAAVPDPAGFAYLGQEFFAEGYLGAGLTFRGEICARGTTGQAGLFLRVRRRGGGSGQSEQDASGWLTQDAALADPDNKVATVTDGDGWAGRQVTARIPGDATTLVVGTFLTGPGQIELRHPELIQGT